MYDSYSVTLDNGGRKEAERRRREKIEEGFEVSGIEGPVLVPRGENYYVPGYRFFVYGRRAPEESISQDRRYAL